MDPLSTRGDNGPRSKLRNDVDPRIASALAADDYRHSHLHLVHTQRDTDAGGFTLEYVKEGDGGDTTDNVHVASLLKKKTEFIIEVIPPQGSVLLVERTTPAILDTVMNLN